MKKLGTIVAGLLALVIVVGMAPPASAATNSNSLGVNPRRDYTIKPGDKVSDTLYVSNLSATDDLTISIQLIDFGAKDETGSPALLLGRQQPTAWSLKSYLTIAKSVKIAAGKSVNLPFSIAIPAKLGAGSYYGAIQYSTGGDGSNSNVALISSAATLIFVRVPGEANDALVLKDFGAFTPDATGESGSFGSFYGGAPPKYLSYRLLNKGNVADQPTGSVVVKNMFGKQVKLFQNANPNNNVVLIDQTRRIDLCLNEQQVTTTDSATGANVQEPKCETPKLMPGRYTAQLAVIYGDNGSSSHELGKTTSFWYIPIWFVAAVIIGLALLVGIIWLIIRNIRFTNRKYNHGPKRR